MNLIFDVCNLGTHTFLALRRHHHDTFASHLPKIGFTFTPTKFRIHRHKVNSTAGPMNRLGHPHRTTIYIILLLLLHITLRFDDVRQFFMLHQGARQSLLPKIIYDNTMPRAPSI